MTSSTRHADRRLRNSRETRAPPRRLAAHPHRATMLRRASRTARSSSTMYTEDPRSSRRHWFAESAGRENSAEGSVPRVSSNAATGGHAGLSAASFIRSDQDAPSHGCKVPSHPSRLTGELVSACVRPTRRGALLTHQRGPTKVERPLRQTMVLVTDGAPASYVEVATPSYNSAIASGGLSLQGPPAVSEDHQSTRERHAVAVRPRLPTAGSTSMTSLGTRSNHAGLAQVADSPPALQSGTSGVRSSCRTSSRRTAPLRTPAASVGRTVLLHVLFVDAAPRRAQKLRGVPQVGSAPFRHLRRRLVFLGRGTGIVCTSGAARSNVIDHHHRELGFLR